MGEVAKFVAQQRRETAFLFRNASLETMIGMSSRQRSVFQNSLGWKFASLKGADSKRVLIAIKPNGFEELWVTRNYTRYRQAFLLFLQQRHHVSVSHIPGHWHVDHLIPRCRFDSDHGGHWIRIFLLEEFLNASFGGGFERQLYMRERASYPSEGTHMDWITFLKSLGIRLPGKNASIEQTGLWIWGITNELKEIGLPNRVANYFGISTMLNLGYNDRYYPLPVPLAVFKDIRSDPVFSIFQDSFFRAGIA